MHTSPTTAAHVLADLDGRVACVLDGGPCTVGVESTVLDLTVSPPAILRPGGVPLEALRAVLGDVALREAVGLTGRDEPADEPAIARAPGQMERHYAPRAVMLVYDGQGPRALAALLAATRAACASGERVGALVPDEEAAALADAGAHVVALGPGDDLSEAARRLYAGLRELDALGVDRIICHTFGESGLGLALRDRLRRAAGGRLLSLPDV